MRNTVNLILTTTLQPGQERQVWAKLKGKGKPEDMVCVVEPSRTLFARTGALAGRLCTRPSNGKCAVRILNPTEEHITLYKNMTVGVLQPAFETVNYVEEEERTPEADDEASESDDLPDTAPTRFGTQGRAAGQSVERQRSFKPVPQGAAKTGERSKKERADCASLR